MSRLLQAFSCEILVKQNTHTSVCIDGVEDNGTGRLKVVLVPYAICTMSDIRPTTRFYFEFFCLIPYLFVFCDI